MDVVLIDCVYSIVVFESGFQVSQDGSLFIVGGFRSYAGDLDQFFCGIEVYVDQRELESIVVVGEVMVFEIISGCYELLFQGQEQIFIQIFDGFILFYLGFIVFGVEDIVIVIDVEGFVLQTGLLEGVFLEIVEEELLQ